MTKNEAIIRCEALKSQLADVTADLDAVLDERKKYRGALERIGRFSSRLSNLF